MKKLALLFLLVSNFLFSQTWQPLTSILSNTISSNQRFDDVFFLNENLGWAANGYFQKYLKLPMEVQTGSHKQQERH